MKKLSKIVALLLAGALTMLLFTACGGGGGSTNTPEEQKVLNQISSQKSVQVTNDEQLREVAKKNLNEDLKFGGTLGNHAFAYNFHVDNLGDDLVVTITARYDYDDTLLSDILKRLSNHTDPKIDASVDQSGTWSKVGVVVKSNETQSYVGIAIRVKKPNK